MMLRKLLVGIILIAVAVTGATLFFRHLQTKALTCRGCNVILISIDTFGAKHASLYDSTLTTTPFLEELAARSIVFDRAYSQAPWTLPSHAAMLTGQYPWDIDVWIARDALPERAVTLAEALKEHGYRTAAFSSGGFVQANHGFAQGFDEFIGSANLYNWEDIPDLFTDAESWLEHNTQQPFFLFMRPFGLHDPYGAIHIDDIVEANTKEGGPTALDASRFQSAYREDVQKADATLRDFFEKLDELGLSDNTVVIITSDHGEEFGEHGTVGFHSVALYDESIHVPLVVVLPKEVTRRVSAPVEIRSIPSTVMELLSLPQERTFAASSLVPAMAGIEVPAEPVRAVTHQERDYLLTIIAGWYKHSKENAENEGPFLERTEPYTDPVAESVIVGDWHLIRTLGGTLELYNIVLDPEEQVDVFDKRQFLKESDRKMVETALKTLSL